MYCEDLFNYTRRKTINVKVGNVELGGENAIRLQSMTNTSTMDTEASAAQAIRISEAGGEIVRLTAQGEREANNLRLIKEKIQSLNKEIPLVADIHFNPKAADTAALYVDKVRINPGNYVDSIKRFSERDYTDEEYAQEIEKIRHRFVPFLNICKKHHTTIRIGVNHGSLSDRIVNRYGDTPQGMVESCMEFLRICVAENFYNVVISIKASNTLIMVQTVRLLVNQMKQEDMNFPLHLGVTEAGEGEDGRIKSAIGIGALLNDGIGDTIRVSLSEDPECEIPVAQKVSDNICRNSNTIHCAAHTKFNPYSYERRKTSSVKNVGAENVPIVIADWGKLNDKNPLPDYVYCGDEFYTDTKGIAKIVNYQMWSGEENAYPLFSILFRHEIASTPAEMCFVEASLEDLTEDSIEFLNAYKHIVLIAKAKSFFEIRAIFHTLLNAKCKVPVVVRFDYNTPKLEDYQIKSSMDTGCSFIDGFGDGIWLSNPKISAENNCALMFSILQSTSARISKTEYISCPSCGRTLYDIKQTVAKVKAATSHLKGLKIAIMGCIVNGPGEMADADFGYIGSGRGKIDLYAKRTCVEKGIPEEEAVEHLLKLIEKSRNNA